VNSHKLVWEGRQQGQSDFLADMGPGWSLYQGGLGSGKTWAAARKFLVMHSLNDSPSMIVAPTYGDLWRYMVPELLRAADEWGVAMGVWSNGHGTIKYPHIDFLDHPIILMSGDQPQRIAGFEVGLIWVDEGARIKEDKTNPTNDGPTQIRSRLRHKKAKVLHGIVSTTPEGLETWVQRDWTDALKPFHRKYKGTTAKNDMLPEGYIADLRATMGKDLQAQYLDGEAVNYSAGRAHATFDKVLHVKPCKWDPRKPLHIGADFNVCPMAWVIAQLSDNRQELIVLDEVWLADNAQVDGAIMAMIARGWNASKGHYELHADKASKRRSTTGDPEIAVLLNTARAQHMAVSGDAFGVNPPIDSRINLLCRMLLDAGGVSRMTIDPRCVHLIEDLEKTARTSNGYDPGPEKKRGHILDALGYLTWDLFQPGIKATVGNWHI
jgi:hypothetical protein